MWKTGKVLFLQNKRKPVLRPTRYFIHDTNERRKRAWKASNIPREEYLAMTNSNEDQV